MFIEGANSMIVNLNKVHYIEKHEECYIKFYYSNNDDISFKYDTTEKRDEDFEKIRKLLNAVEILNKN